MHDPEEPGYRTDFRSKRSKVKVTARKLTSLTIVQEGRVDVNSWLKWISEFNQSNLFVKHTEV